MVELLSYFLIQPVFYDWYNKGCDMCYPVCGVMHIKEPLLLIGFPLSLSEWSFTICLTPYNRTENVLSASMNKTFPSFLPHNRKYNVLSALLNKTFPSFTNGHVSYIFSIKLYVPLYNNVLGMGHIFFFLYILTF